MKKPSLENSKSTNKLMFLYNDNPFSEGNFQRFIKKRLKDASKTQGLS